MTSIYDCEICQDKDDTIRGLREQCNKWEKAWDELFSHVSVYVRYGTASFNDREMCRRMNDLDPRNKEKG